MGKDSNLGVTVGTSFVALIVLLMSMEYLFFVQPELLPKGIMTEIFLPEILRFRFMTRLGLILVGILVFSVSPYTSFLNELTTKNKKHVSLRV